MKTNYSTRRTLPLLSISALMVLILASCGSYQKTSDERQDAPSGDQTSAQSIYYKNYFSSLNEENEEIITDVDNYSSNSQDTTYVEKSYGGWGSTNENVTVNIYDNSWGYNPWYGVGWGWGGYYGAGWGLSLGWGGWGPWYGYGWGGYYPYYGVGYPYYGGYYNNNFYGRNSPNRYYANNNTRDGRRFTTPTSGRGGRYYNDNVATGRNSQSVRSGNQGNRPTTYRTTTNRNTSVRNATTNPGNRNSPQVRGNSGTRNNNYTPSRSPGVRSQPSSAPTRSYSPGSSGGSRPSGGGGGGRSGGSGGGRRG